MKFMEEIKSNSSKWIKDMGDRYRNFYWQNGYGAFSVSASELEDVKVYIDAQRITITKKPFRMNSGIFCGCIMWTTMSGMFGIKDHRAGGW